jgi:hypothetical protein
MQVDLERAANVTRIQVYPYWDSGRYYQYTVEVSTDGKAWTQVADRSQNTRPATPEGDTIELAARPVRFVRVTLTHNSANPSVHLVELRVFEAE